MSHFHILGPATRAILHYKQRVCDLINGYIRKQERKWKLKPSFFMCYLVVRYHAGEEQFNKSLSEKLLYQFESNGKKLSYKNDQRSVKVSHLWPDSSIRLPLQCEWNVKNSMNIEWNFFAISEDFETTFRLGAQIVGLFDQYVSFEFPEFIIGDIASCVGDQIRVRIEIKSDTVTMKMKLVMNDDNLIAPWTIWKACDCGEYYWGEYCEVKHTLDKLESVEDDVVMCVFIEMVKRVRNGKGAEMHLISHSVTFDN